MRARPGTALLLDAAHTLLHLREPVGTTYARLGRPHGLELDPEQVDRGFRAAFREVPDAVPRTRDGRPFWRWIVHRATGSDDARYFEALYEHYATAAPWRLADGARSCCVAVRARGMRVAVVSNWDERLPRVLEALRADFLDEIVFSGAEGFEKPDPRLFLRALARLRVPPAQAVHVGDDPIADGDGARAAGCSAWLIGHDVGDFHELERRLVG